MKPIKKAQQVKAQWNFYFNKTKDASTAVNLALIEIGPIKEKPNLARLTIIMNNPEADGFSSDKESGIYVIIEAALVKQGKANNNWIHVARHTGSGKWINYFYCHDTDSFRDSVCNVMAGFPDYQYEFEFQKDKNWSVYLNSLFPTEWQFRSMSNRDLVYMLHQHGIDLSQDREVEHTILFKNKTGRKTFLKEAKKLGFISKNNFFESSIKNNPYGLEISRVDKVDLVSVDTYVYQLFELAKQHHGFYDGWAAVVHKNEFKPVSDTDLIP